ncbi:MAG: TIM-barrel domain-containing protein [Planctomycetota bacterium]
MSDAGVRTRYRFPSRRSDRIRRALGLGDLEWRAKAGASELVGEGIARFCRADAEPGAFPPSQAVDGERGAIGAVPDGWRARPVFARAGDGREVVRLSIDEGTDLYGTGEIAGPLRRNGRVTRAWNTDRPCYTGRDPSLYQSHPWVLAVRADGSAFGVLVDSSYAVQIDLRGDIVMRVEGPACWVYVIEGDSPQQVLMRLGELCGRMEMPPLWSLGYHQCRFTYEPTDRVLELARTFREREIPCDVIWLDIDYMDRYRVFTFDPVKFPDPRGLNDELHAMGFKSVWMIDPAPATEDGYGVYEQGSERGFWVQTWEGRAFHGSVWPPDVVFPDFTRADVCDWWAGLYIDFMAHGIDGVWNDMNEPALVVDGKEVQRSLPLDCAHAGGFEGLPAGPHAQYHNLYGTLMVRATREGVLRANPEKRPFVLTRAGSMGVQRYAATWTGDNRATWDDLGWSISMVLNLGLSGQAFSGPDVGGFVGAGTPEMMARWWGLAFALPFCRAHAAKGNIDKEPWSFGGDVESTIRRALQRRYRLLPCLYTLFREAHETGLPVARPVFFADPSDKRLRHEDRAFLLGSDVLVVAQVSESGDARHALPAGDWRSFEPVEGGADGALAELRVRPGAIVPMGPSMQHTGERALDPLTLVVCPDEHGRASGRLYEDAGEGWGFRTGDFSDLAFEGEFERAGGADGSGVVRVRRLGGDRAVATRAVEVEVLTPGGVVRGRGRVGDAGEIRVGGASWA